jgi:hypothetical protein
MRHTAVARGYHANGERWSRYESIGNRGVISEWVATNILEDIEAVALIDVFYMIRDVK